MIEGDVVFKKTVGSRYEYIVYTGNGAENRSGEGIYSIIVANNKSATLESNIMAVDIELGNKSKLVLNPAFRNIEVNTGIGTNLAADGDGIIEIAPSDKHTVTFLGEIGDRDIRVGEINISRTKAIIFNNNVYAKNIKIASSGKFIEFKEKLDMQQYNLDGKGNRLVLLGAKDTGNLEFTNHGKVKFHKDFAGDITTNKNIQGIVTFADTHDIYGIGSKDKKLERLIFEGNHVHNLHKNIHARQVDFDAGTYNIATKDVPIDGTANINGSTLNLDHNLIFTGAVEFSNNITLNVKVGKGLVFENNLPSAAPGTNITINVGGAPPVNDLVALSVFNVNGGTFSPMGYVYDAKTGVLAFAGPGGVVPINAQAQAEVQQALAQAQQQEQARQEQARLAQEQQQALARQQQEQARLAQEQQQALARQQQEQARAQQQALAGQQQGQARVQQQEQAQDQQQVQVRAQAQVLEQTPASVLVPTAKPSVELANAISNIIVSASQKTLADKATQEVINKKSAFVMQNPEKHAAELAKELANSGTSLKEAAKVANDDAYVTGKTKQEQSLLFVATLSQIAPDKQEEAVKHLTDQATRSVSVANVTTEAVGANITNHLSGSNTAIAAGDEDDDSILSSKKGIWVAGTFGSSNQGIYKGGASYNGKVAGSTIGGDLYIGDNGFVGIAYSNMSSNFKFTGANPGDKLSANSNVISIYGQQQFNNGFMLQGIFSGSNSKITKKDSRQVGANIYKLATGKYTSKAYAFETTVGYQVATINDISLMPNIGIRYNSYKDEAYTETGTGVNNMYVAAKSGNMVTGIAGMKITMSKKLSEDTQIIPGIHASIENSFNNKQQKVKARFIWADNYFENAATASTPKVGYNLGASLLTKHKNIEVLATYNCNLRSKYHSHQGSLKLKLLF